MLNAVLHLDSLPTALMVGLAAFPLTYMGAQAGVLQGERRWSPLALVYLAQGIGRFGFGLVLILIWPTELAAMAGVAFGCWLPVLFAWLALRRPRADVPHSEGHPGLDLLREVGHSSQALLAFFALSNADILVARATMSNSQAGLYAGGLIMAKAVLFLPQFVVVYAFPSLSREEPTGAPCSLAMGLSATLGSFGVLGVLVLPDLALLFVGGERLRGDQGRPLEVRDRRHPAVDDPAARLLGAGPPPGARGDHDLDRARRARGHRPRGQHGRRAGMVVVAVDSAAVPGLLGSP